jgi:alcohol dehydrogenase YqhD (iron-dependent ADH family)
LNLLVVTLSKAMMEIVLLEDRDESWEFSDKEINRLIMRMKNLPAIKVNEDKLRAQVQKQRSFYSVIGLLQDINDETIAEEDHIFVVNEEEYELQESE